MREPAYKTQREQRREQAKSEYADSLLQRRDDSAAHQSMLSDNDAAKVARSTLTTHNAADSLNLDVTAAMTAPNISRASSSVKTAGKTAVKPSGSDTFYKISQNMGQKRTVYKPKRIRKNLAKRGEGVVGSAANTLGQSDDIGAKTIGTGYRGVKTGVHTTTIAAKGVGGVITAEGKMLRDLAAKKYGEAAKDVAKGAGGVVKSGAGLASAGIKNAGQSTTSLLRRSDDLGAKAAGASYSAVSKARRTTRAARRTAGTTIRTTRRVARGGIRVAALAIKSIGLLLPLIAIIAPIILVVGIIPTFSLTNTDWELSITYKYIVRRDVRFQQDINRTINATPDDWQTHFYLNGQSSTRMAMRIETNADNMLNYFDTRYGEYQLNSTILFWTDDTTVRQRINNIHNAMHNFSHYDWTETITVYPEYPNEYGEYPEPETITIRHRNIMLETMTFDQYVDQTLIARLDEEQRERYEAIREVGTYTFRNILSSPFPDINWHWHKTQRFGWRLLADNTIQEYNAIGVTVPPGTATHAPTFGTVREVTRQADGTYHVVFSNAEERIRFSGLTSTTLSEGDAVHNREQIGIAGGYTSIAFRLNGQRLNPLFYMENDLATSDERQSYGNAGYPLTLDEAERLRTVAERYLGFPYQWGGSAPPAFDCSGFVIWVLRQAGIANMSRVGSTSMYINYTIRIPPDHAMPGDLIFFHSTFPTDRMTSHVGLYMGGGYMIHAGSPIHYANIHTPYWTRHFFGFGRVIR